MQTVLAGVAVAAAALGLVYANLAPQEGRGGSRLQALVGAGLSSLWPFCALWIAVLFLLTTPTAAPFSRGLTLGWGFLIGAVLGLYALYEAYGSFRGPDWHARAVGLFSAAALGPAAILLVFRGYPTEALTGCALGAVLLAAIGAGILRPSYVASPPDRREARAAYRGLEVFALLSVTVAAGARLGLDHFARLAPGAVEGGYWAFPALAMAATALMLILLAGEVSIKWLEDTDLTWQAGLFVVALTGLLQGRVLPGLGWELPLYGVLGLVVVLYALSSAGKADEERPVVLAFGAVLLALAVATLAFKSLHGYGEALALLAAAPVAAVAYLRAERAREPLAESLTFGAATLCLLLALYRVFLETAGRGWAMDFQSHYDYLCVLLGVGACFGLLAFASQGVESVRRARAHGKSGIALLMARTTLLGVVIAAVPVVLTAVWGVKAIGGFLTGLVIGEATWMLLAAWVVGEERQKVLAAAPHVYFLAAALLATQFAPQVLALELTRAHKIALVAVITVVAVGWILADALGRARLSRRRETADEPAD